MATFDFELRKKRQFGEFISDAFTFLRQNFGVLCISFIKYVLPFVIIGGYLYGAFFGKLFDNILIAQDGAFSSATNILMFIGCMFAIMLGYIVMQAIVYGVFHHKLSNETTELTSDYLGNFVLSNFGKLCLVFLAITFIVLLPIFLISSLAFIFMDIGVGIFSVFLVFIYMFFAVYYTISWYLAPFIIVHDPNNLGVMDALRSSKNLVKGYWWSFFGLLFVAGIIGSILSLVFTLPLQLATVSAELTELGTERTSNMTMGLYGILSYIGTTFVSMFTVSCLVLKYLDLKERKEGSSLISKIENFGNEQESSFENEGEF